MRCLVPVLLVIFALPAPAAAQGVKRCTDAQGNSVFTDRACASVDAVPKGEPAPSPGAYAQGFAIRGCARTPEALLQGVRTALEARDVNRLASYYHWAGTGTRSGLQVMDDLEAIATRPFAAVALAYPAGPGPVDPLLAFGPGTADAAPSPGTEGAGPTWPGSPSPDARDAGRPGEAGPTATPPPDANPIGLDVQQMAGDTDAGSRRTRFRLLRHVDCWWVEL